MILRGTTETTTKLCLSMGLCLSSSSCFLRGMSSPQKTLFSFWGKGRLGSARCVSPLHLAPRPLRSSLRFCSKAQLSVAWLLRPGMYTEVSPFGGQRGEWMRPQESSSGFVRRQPEAASRLTPSACFYSQKVKCFGLRLQAAAVRLFWFICPDLTEPCVGKIKYPALFPLFLS